MGSKRHAMSLRISHTYISGFARTWQVPLWIDLETGNMYQALSATPVMVASKSDRLNIMRAPEGADVTLNLSLRNLDHIPPDEMVDLVFGLIAQHKAA